MPFKLVMAIAALVSAALLAWRSPQDRNYAFGAVGASALVLLMVHNIVRINFTHAVTIVWAAIAVLGGLLWVRQQAKLSATFATVLCASGALPLLAMLGLMH